MFEQVPTDMHTLWMIKCGIFCLCFLVDFLCIHIIFSYISWTKNIDRQWWWYVRGQGHYWYISNYKSWKGDVRIPNIIPKRYFFSPEIGIWKASVTLHWVDLMSTPCMNARSPTHYSWWSSNTMHCNSKTSKCPKCESLLWLHMRWKQNPYKYKAISSWWASNMYSVWVRLYVKNELNIKLPLCTYVELGFTDL